MTTTRWGSWTELTVDAAAATHVGRRENNEDAYLLDAGHAVFAVADGMGGYHGGEVASALVVVGIAKATRLASNTAAAIRRGKYAYMSPEQVSGAPLSSRSDQFGFGVMLHELLLGTRPFDGPTPLETMDRVREAAPPDLGALDADLAAIVSTCLARDPDERFETAEALQRALAAARRLRDAVGSADLGRWVRANLDGAEVRPRTRTATLPIGE